jgi:RNA polymerase sigma-70 factor (ECF subfamily)
LTRDPNSAEDLVQETFVRAFRAADKFQLQSFGIRPWLIRIMHNLHFTRAERDKRKPTSIDDEMLDAAATTDPASDGGGALSSGAVQGLEALRSGLFEQLDERLADAVGELQPEYQTALLLWAVDGFSYKEIADACDVPIGTVMSRLHRARQKLAERLGEYAREQRVIREEPGS